MNVNHHHKALFFHIPKTGGTAIHLAMSRYERLKDESPENIKKEFWHFYLGMHGSYTMLKKDKNTKDEYEKLKKYFKFCFVRNPWSHAVSYYFHWLHLDKFLRLDKRHQEDDWKNFKWFLESKFYEPQEKYTFNDPEFENDRWFRYEDLQKCWDTLCRKFDYNFYTLPNDNSSKDHKNILGLPYPDDYREMFDEESKQMVAERAKNEIQKFKYTFNPSPF